jgi:antitoxin VapB
MGHGHEGAVKSAWLTRPGYDIYHCYLPRRLPVATAKVFWSGRSQAVRLPKEFRVDGEEVRIRRVGRAIVLEPILKDWSWLHAWRAKYGKFDDDFVAAAREETPQQERAELDALFK